MKISKNSALISSIISISWFTISGCQPSLLKPVQKPVKEATRSLQSVARRISDFDEYKPMMEVAEKPTDAAKSLDKVNQAFKGRKSELLDKVGTVEAEEQVGFD